MSQTGMNYLGFILTGQRSPLQERKEAISSLTPPKTRKQLRGFPRMAMFSHNWLPNYGLIASPQYGELKGKDDDPFECNSECDSECEGAF